MDEAMHGLGSVEVFQDLLRLKSETVRVILSLFEEKLRLRERVG
jgi:hypothetical protein